MSLRALVGLCALATTCALAAPAGAAGPEDRVFDAVNGYELTSDSVTARYRPFKVTGILRGQTQVQTLTYRFQSETTAEAYATSCERFALLAMKSAGHFAFVVVTDPLGSGTTVTGCRLERR